MHDPMVVAFEIRNPIPRRVRWKDRRPGAKRWTLGRRRYVNAEHLGEAIYHWWLPRAWEPRIAGRAFGTRSFITVWHVEPGGHDSGDVCPHYTRWQDEDGRFHSKPLNAWRWHVHHWRIQVAPLQDLRRRLFQRCAWCGGRSTKKNCVNHSLSWDGPKAKHFWRSHPGVYHGGCSSAPGVQRACLCESPLVTGKYEMCAGCGKRFVDEARWIGTRAAVARNGMPVEGRPWSWPADINVHKIKQELEAQEVEGLRMVDRAD